MSMVSPAAIAPRPAPARARAAAAPGRVRLLSGIAVSLVFVASLSAWVLIGLDGWSYYRTPITIRGYHPQHRLLRPSGTAGLAFGIAGATLLLVPFAYMLVKRLPRLRRGTSLQGWLEVHIFCGIAGPALISYHTSFKFNGLVSVAYWSMLLVSASGFVGRYLYVRIPRTIRGVELSDRELMERLGDIRDALAESAPAVVLQRLDALEAAAAPAERPSIFGLVVGDLRLRKPLREFETALRASGAAAGDAASAAALVRERWQLTRRLACLERTRALFDLWHVWHLPLVYVMFAIVAMHVALVVYLGYGPSF